MSDKSRARGGEDAASFGARLDHLRRAPRVPPRSVQPRTPSDLFLDDLCAALTRGHKLPAGLNPPVVARHLHPHLWTIAEWARAAATTRPNRTAATTRARRAEALRTRRDALPPNALAALGNGWDLAAWAASRAKLTPRRKGRPIGTGNEPRHVLDAAVAKAVKAAGIPPTRAKTGKVARVLLVVLRAAGFVARSRGRVSDEQALNSIRRDVQWALNSLGVPRRRRRAAVRSGNS